MEKVISNSTAYYRSLSPEKRAEISKKKYESAKRRGVTSSDKMKQMTPEEKRAYNHERYMRHREEYIERAKAYQKNRAISETLKD